MICRYQIIINIIISDYTCVFAAMTYQNISHEKGLWAKMIRLIKRKWYLSHCNMSKCILFCKV